MTAATNGYDGDELQEFLQAIAKQHDALDALKSDYMLKCRGPRGHIKETLKTVKDSEINITAFRSLVKKALADRKHEKRIAALEEDDADAYELMVEALGAFGDTPLGAAALKRARPKGDEALDGL